MIGKFRNHAWESRIISERYFKEKESEKAIVQPHNINSAYAYIKATGAWEQVRPLYPEVSRHPDFNPFFISFFLCMLPKSDHSIKTYITYRKRVRFFFFKCLF